MKATFISSLELNNELKTTKELCQIPPVFARFPLAPFGMTSPWALLGSYYVLPGNRFGQFVLFQYSTRVENKNEIQNEQVNLHPISFSFNSVVTRVQLILKPKYLTADIIASFYLSKNKT